MRLLTKTKISLTSAMSRTSDLRQQHYKGKGLLLAIKGFMSDLVFIPAAYDKFVDVRIGEWIQVAPHRFSSLFISSSPLPLRTSNCYYCVSKNILREAPPLEFGGSDWDPVKGPGGDVTHFVNFVSGAQSHSPAVLEPQPLPAFASFLVRNMEICEEKRSDDSRKQTIARLLAEARVARGVDPVFGNPPQ
jgi:hypothetical protein